MEKKVVGTLLALAMCASTAFAAPANEVNVTVDPGTKVNVSVKQKGVGPSDVANWEKGEATDIVEMGTGARNPKFTGAQARLMARRAAIVDCYRNLVARVQGVQVDAETTMENLMVTSDVVKNKMAGAIKGAKIIEEGELDDGAYYVKMALPMYGANSVAAAALPEVMKDTPKAEPAAKVTTKTTAMPKEEFKATVKEVISSGYTGIVIDASGKGLECTMAPQIIDTNGRVVYGKENIDLDFAVTHGLADYKTNLNDATNGSSRAGKNPLVIKATAVKGGSNSVNPVNAVVSPEDADKILLAVANNADVFKNGAIVFVK